MILIIEHATNRLLLRAQNCKKTYRFLRTGLYHQTSKMKDLYIKEKLSVLEFFIFIITLSQLLCGILFSYFMLFFNNIIGERVKKLFPLICWLCCDEILVFFKIFRYCIFSGTSIRQNKPEFFLKNRCSGLFSSKRLSSP